MARKTLIALTATSVACLCLAGEVLAKGSTSGFSRSMSAPYIPQSSSGFGSSSKSISRPSSSFDSSVSRGLSNDAYKSATPAPTLSSPPPRTPSSLGSSAAPSTTGNSYISGGSVYPRRIYSTVYIHDNYGSFNDFYTGMLVERLFNSSSNSSAYQDGLNDGEIRQKLRDIANNPATSADESVRIRKAINDADLGAAADLNKPIAAKPGENQKDGGSMFPYVLLAAAGAGGGALYLRRRKPKQAADLSFAKTDVTKSNREKSPAGMIKFNPAVFVLAEAGGGISLNVPNSASICDRSAFDLYDSKVKRAYFNESKAFVETSGDESRLFVLCDERFPEDADAWAFFLGKGKKPGYIGSPDVSIEDLGNDYVRVWSPGDKAIKPAKFSESLQGGASREHEAMLYARDLTNGKREFLYFEAVRSADSASIQLWTGLDLAKSDFEII